MICQYVLISQPSFEFLKFSEFDETLRKPKVEDNSRRTIIGIVSGSVQSMAMRELQAGVAAIFHFPVHIIRPPGFFLRFDRVLKEKTMAPEQGLPYTEKWKALNKQKW